MESSLVITQSFLNAATADNIRLTARQLHTLVFFAHGLHLGAFDGKPLIDEIVRAWTFGPMIPEVFNLTQRLSSSLKRDLPLIGMVPLKPDSTEAQAVAATWNVYKECSDQQLDVIATTPDGPWDIVWNQLGDKFCAIPDSVIRTYYAKALSAQKAI